MDSHNDDSPSPSPPPADDLTHRDLQHASMSDIILHLRRRANDRRADGHSRHRQHQQRQMYVTNMDYLFPPVRKPDGTVWSSVIFSDCPHLSDAIHRHHPYRRTEHQQRGRQPSPAPPPPPPPHDDDQVATKVVCLAKMLSPGDRLHEDGFYLDFLEDVTKEAQKFGDLVKVVIPRPGHVAAPVVAGVGKVFLEYASLDDAAWCRRRLDGRRFRWKKMAATFFSQDRFAAGDYGHDR